MRRRAAFVAACIVIVTLGVAQPAQAGGSWIEVRGGPRLRIGPWNLPYAAVGATVTMRGDFSTGQQAPVSAGPWYAYLTAEADVGRHYGEPMLLGPVQITSSGGYPYTATTTFAVPDVPTGYYWVNVCDLGCTQGVGDLAGGTIVLGATEVEARLFARIHILTLTHQGDARTIEHLRDQRDELTAEIARVERVAARWESASRFGSERAEGLATDVDRTAALLVEADRRASLWRGAAVMLLAALLVVFAAASVRSRRNRRVRVPDTLAELVEASDRGPAKV